MKPDRRIVEVAALALTAAWFSPSVIAAEQVATVSVIRVMPMSLSRPSSSAYEGLTRVYFATASLGTCRSDAADIELADKHILSALLAAWHSGVQVQVFVDDTVRLVSGDTTCKVTAISSGTPFF